VFCVHVCLLYVWFVCVLFVPSVLWYCWLGLLTCKNRLPYNVYCVGGDVKHCTINQSMVGRSHWHYKPLTDLTMTAVSLTDDVKSSHWYECCSHNTPPSRTPCCAICDRSQCVHSPGKPGKRGEYLSCWGKCKKSGIGRLGETVKGKGKADDLYRSSMQFENHRRTALQYPPCSLDPMPLPTIRRF